MNQESRTAWNARATALALVSILLVGGLGPEAIGADAAKHRAGARKFQQFSNGTPITITDNKTSPPSTIEVSGFDTPIADVNVSLNVYSHPQPADVDVLLVGPQGQTALIMSDVAGASKAANDSLILDDQAESQLPSQEDITSGKFQPTNYDFASQPDKFAPDPRIPSPLSSGSALAIFNGTNANGTWTLFVVDADDDTPDTNGSIAGGWGLTITTANGVPRTQPDTFQAQAGQTLDVPAAGVLDNDTDLDGDLLTAVLAAEPAKGQVTLQPDGAFTYRANKRAKGTDSFTYLAQDTTGLQALETVTIQVKGKKHKKHKH
jgi:VCBS repeat-containing protein